MRISVLAMLIFFPAALLRAQPSPEAKCTGGGLGLLTDAYYDAVVDRIEAPGKFDALITITTGRELKLVLRTDGEKFELLTNTFDNPNEHVHSVLDALAQSCRLPPDPKDAVALLKVKWETKELSSAQFAKMHGDFLVALSEYVSNTKERSKWMMETRLSGIYLDAWSFSIVYDNHTQHIQLVAWDVAEENNKLDPIANWGHELQKLAEESFHRPFLRKPNE
ncbi:MAG: hypothetical protein WAN12_09230 [Candidatus Acidiferrum sp.]|jgi:hypothetical protein